MATFIKIASVTVGSGGASTITFSSIPQTYTDLCMKLSIRGLASNTNEAYYINVNGTGYGGTRRAIYGTGSNAGTETASNIRWDYFSDSAATSNTFGSGDLYIPNYTGSNNKSMSMEGVAEGNTSGMFMAMTAALWSSTSAITSLSLEGLNGNIAQHSTAVLYGINKS
jgi:hypothetical protein